MSNIKNSANMKNVVLIGASGFVGSAILKEAKRSGVRRLLIVGGAGTLFVKPGVRLVDTGTLPDAWMPGGQVFGRVLSRDTYE